VHKAVSAKPATCTGCHHNPQNERCESCHRAQSAFYRGQVTPLGVKAEPNAMAEAVRRAGRPAPDAEALVRQAAEALALVQKARGAHNPAGAESILEAVRAKADTAADQGLKIVEE
jgi:hypothetical protein